MVRISLGCRISYEKIKKAPAATGAYVATAVKQFTKTGKNEN